MKKFILALSFVFSPIAVNAGQVLPSLYASKFCEMRAAGLSKEDAAKVAMQDAYISSGQAAKVTWNGRLIDSDVLQASIAVVKKCPDLAR